MGETLNLQFRSRDDGSFELQVKESWSGHTIRGDFIPPYTSRQLGVLLKKLNTLETDERELSEIGQRLFQGLCGAPTPGVNPRDSAEHSVQAMLRSVIQRTLRRRGTVALTLSFASGCDEFVRYPWELLHNGEHFLLASGVFTLTRALLRSDLPSQCELPIYPPLRVLYIGSSPSNCPPLETEQSFESLKRGLSSLMEEGQLLLDRLEPPTFDELVRYLSSAGGAGAFEDQETAIPCYVIHYDGHGAFGRLCPADDCDELNEADARKCSACQTPLGKVKPQTYLCFCNDKGRNRFIGTESLRELFVSTDVRLAVFSACETARLEEHTRQKHRRAAVDATLATALVMAQVPAVVAMPFSLQDDLSPIFTYHFYDAIAHGRTLEEALARARQAMLPIKQYSWFVPVLYRHVVEGEESPVALLAGRDEPQEHDHPLRHLSATSTFVGREREIQELTTWLEDVVNVSAKKLKPKIHHVALTGPAGIGKSELALETARRNQEKFPGGITGISLQGGKPLGEALLEMAHVLHIHSKAMNMADTGHCERTVLNAFRGLATRDLTCLLLLDGFEEIQANAEVGSWYRFLCALPEQVVVMLTSRSNPSTIASLEGAACRWYEYPVRKMPSQDILKLFAELAAGSGLDERIHLSEANQQAILQEICTLLDGYPLGAQLIFGTARPIHGKIYAPEAATRSLEEVRDELREALPEGMWALLDIAYRRLSPAAQLLLPYLAAFKLPFSHQQIVMLVAPETPASARALGRMEHEHYLQVQHQDGTDATQNVAFDIPSELAKSWRAARDELVQTSFLQFDGRVYTIHAQVRHFALAHLQADERRRVHRVVAAYYSSLPQPSPEEWFASFEHLEDAGEAQDLHKAIQLIVSAANALRGRGYASSLRVMLRRAETYALSLGDTSGEALVQYSLGSILRQLGKYAEALGCLTRSLTLHRQQSERDEEAWALYELAMLFREEGQYAQANQHAEAALRLFRETNDPRGIAWMQTVLGEVNRGHGYYYDALGHFELALATFRGLPNEEGYPWTLRDRGTVYEALGSYAEAMADYEESLRLFNSLGSRFGQAWVLVDQSAVYLDQADFQRARAACNEALVIFHEQGAKRGEAWTLYRMGDVARKQQQYNDARAYCNQSLVLFSDLGDRVDTARIINSLGAISFAEGAYPEAKEDFEHARAIARGQESHQIEGRALRGLGDIARATRQFGEAERYYNEAAAIARHLDTPSDRCAVLHRQGELHATQGHYKEALTAWVEALFQDRRSGHPERAEHEARVTRFVAEHHLEETYTELSKQFGLS
ncbi:MAG TPA: tetratricopeptide repeat protein [Ktedonobacteraceae bacterium]|nr:tetratricopeptide repeat protein [Ktedonobacteraceae bacterium]